MHHSRERRTLKSKKKREVKKTYEVKKKPLSKRLLKKLEVKKTREKYRVPHHTQFKLFINREIESICERSSYRYGVYKNVVRILKERFLNVWYGIGLPDTVSSLIFEYMFKQKKGWEYENESLVGQNSWSHMNFVSHIIPTLYVDYTDFQTKVTVRTRFAITFGVTDVDFDLNFYKMGVMMITTPAENHFERLNILDEFAFEIKTTALFKQYQFNVSPTNELFHAIYSTLSVPNHDLFDQFGFMLNVTDIKEILICSLINLVSEVMIISYNFFNYDIKKHITYDPRSDDFYLQKPFDGEPENFIMRPEIFAGEYYHNVPDDVRDEGALFEQVIPFWVELKSGGWMKTSVLVTVYHYFFNGVSWYYLSMISKVNSIDEDGNTIPFEITDNFYKIPITNVYRGETMLNNTMVGFRESYHREIDLSATERWCKQFVFHPAFIDCIDYTLIITREQFTGEIVEPDIHPRFSFPEEGEEFDYNGQNYVWDGEPIVEVQEPNGDQYPLGSASKQFTLRANQVTTTLVEQFLTHCQKEKMLPVDSWKIIFLFRLMMNFSS